MLAAASHIDRPFAPPLDVVLDLPAPPSVNRVRKIDWRMAKKFQGWTRSANALVLAAKMRQRDPIKICNRLLRFEVHIVLSEHHTKIDLDNGVKWLVDYLKKIEVIFDDGPQHMRRLVVEWGTAPEGARVTVRPMA